MRVIIAGHTGIEKERCLRALGLAIARDAGLPEDLENVRTRAKVRIYSLEDYLAHRVGSSAAFLEAKDPIWREEEWRKAVGDLKADLAAQPAEFELIALHATFQRSGVMGCPVDVREIESLAPERFVTLIDDIYDVWRRIQLRDEQAHTDFLLRLREFAMWRSVEILTVDLVARAISTAARPIENLVLAVKHPAETARRIVLGPASSRVYAACSITAPRRVDGGIDEVNSYRRAMYERYAAFDPLTIDERLTDFFSRAEAARKSEEPFVELVEADRWPIDREGTLIGIEPDLYPMRLPVDEVLEVVGEIDRQIEGRDFRLVRQSHAMAAYRPYFRGTPSMGVFSELKFARDAAHKHTHIYSPDSDQLSNSPFASERIVHTSEKEFYGGLDAALT